MTEYGQNLTNDEKWYLCRFLDDHIKGMENYQQKIAWRITRIRQECDYNLVNEDRYEEKKWLKTASIVGWTIMLARKMKSVILDNTRGRANEALGIYRRHPHVEIWKNEWRFHKTCPPEPFDGFFRAEWEIFAVYRDYVGFES
jgi:hypothetical protein